MKNCNLILGDCLEKLKEIPNNSIDLILCDLPYGTTQNKWDSIIDLSLLWKQYERIIKKNGAVVLTAQCPFDKILGCSNLVLLKYEWIWEKPQGTGHLNSKKYPLKNHENILVFCKKPHKYNPQMVGTEKRTIKRKKRKAKITNYREFNDLPKNNYIGRFPKTILKFNQEKGLHPTQKPVKLFEYLIKTYTDERDIVLDNCMGSGTTGVACINLNRNFIGIEINKEYFNIAKNRIKEVQNQRKII